MLIQGLCLDTWLASRYSHIITISHTLSFRKLSTMSSLCSICRGPFKNLTKHINYKHMKFHKSFKCDICFETYKKSHDLRSHKQTQHQIFFQPIFEGDYHPLPENFDILDTFFKFLDTFFKFLDTFFKFWTLVSSFWTQFSSFDSHFLNICHLAVAPKSWWQVPAKQES